MKTNVKTLWNTAKYFDWHDVFVENMLSGGREGWRFYWISHGWGDTVWAGDRLVFTLIFWAGLGERFIVMKRIKFSLWSLYLLVIPHTSGLYDGWKQMEFLLQFDMVGYFHHVWVVKDGLVFWLCLNSMTNVLR